MKFRPPPVLLTALLACPLLPARAFSVLTAGHADIGVDYEEGELHPHWHLHGEAIVNGRPLAEEAEFAPDELLAYVSDPSAARPPGSPWDFLGTPAGSPLWVLPAVEDPAQPFIGLASEELTPADWTSLHLRLVQFAGPAGGHFSLWQADALGNPVVRMATSNGLDASDQFELTVGGHQHLNYGFTQPGLYELTFQWDGLHVADGPVSARATYAFGVTVIPEPRPATLLALGFIGWLACTPRRRRS
jgi:surface-anchored protein